MSSRRNDMGLVPVPRELNANAKIFIWDFDVAALFVFGFAIGIMVGSLIVGAILGVLFSKAWSKIRQGRAKGFGIHTLYWYLPGKPFRRSPESFRRNFMG
ncbi:type IV conjugative transfer system protein TraL [Parasutterella secunda]|uniref:type IV conjugative transfer system protein TraL n=1 Tax=Parasutterella secunda TaxID=626947 RepID=UPI0025A4C2AD|nr:type IV conjugative transfer system protein TraL [Parasutterella secunda]MDM8112835.1 type IV conjugative transfer system protein TraL [Parasutterella secunda]